MALLAPLLMFLFVVMVDFARVFYYSLALANCARNGALYQCDEVGQARSTYSSLTDAALADAGNITPAPTVSVTVNTSTEVEVTATYNFRTLVPYPGVPSTIALTRKVRMQKIPAVPG
jgi:Flp pilus assembly protein TadG